MIPAFTEVGAPDAPFLGFLLHGVLGAGHNFRSFAKRLTDARPEYRFLLLDVRHHGRSVPAPPPNTIAECARDLDDLVRHLERAPRVVIGHSMGGKIALTFGREVVDGTTDARARAIEQFWALDSDPGPQRPGEDHQVRRVVRALHGAPGPFETRAAAVSALESGGLSSGLANWLVSNLERSEDGLRWKLDLRAIGELLDDYFARDEWPFLSSVAERSGAPEFHLLVADGSDRWSGSMRERAELLPRNGALRVHELADSGHWVHVDNPDGLLTILADHLPR